MQTNYGDGPVVSTILFRVAQAFVMQRNYGYATLAQVLMMQRFYGNTPVALTIVLYVAQAFMMQRKYWKVPLLRQPHFTYLG